ncbi:MAG: class I tRNA ligase family protein [Candidatus Sericytochromatia bacterium]|uniref:leucine--tRNA ligase n=1 Tax=Candidatus Tanganyikabacteria bacterium TaxID=2961651 RepID=A0A937X0P6_9BACT|nr:class I tRNA ligase family protein [Candidatus Tanganyikabacteria bacterium]
MTPADKEIRRQTHLAIKKVTDDLEREFGFNTAISHIMVLSNSLGEYLREGSPKAAYARDAAEKLVLLLAPFAPHLAEELWRELGQQDYVAFADWPTYESEALRTDEVELAVQVNGKVRGRIRVPAEADQKRIESAALAEEETRPHLDGKEVVKVIVVPGRLVNIVAR